ncbi:MAG: hypothetical protein EPN21_17735 [Methylococcaceae bacterium]|nr:MAG: hypothetical protein EPN21_17735 [Methylococcaceae bacterium]
MAGGGKTGKRTGILADSAGLSHAARGLDIKDLSAVINCSRWARRVPPPVSNSIGEIRNKKGREIIPARGVIQTGRNGLITRSNV